MAVSKITTILHFSLSQWAKSNPIVLIFVVHIVYHNTKRMTMGQDPLSSFPDTALKAWLVQSYTTLAICKGNTEVKSRTLLHYWHSHNAKSIRIVLIFLHIRSIASERKWGWARTLYLHFQKQLWRSDWKRSISHCPFLMLTNSKIPTLLQI